MKKKPIVNSIDADDMFNKHKSMFIIIFIHKNLFFVSTVYTHNTFIYYNYNENTITQYVATLLEMPVLLLVFFSF